ncbi:MAG: hypothetical protein J7J46_09415 [Candidatus Desulfofervidus sp.]|nr:hypothetical protein [Candidatus Desulfofervidus sp.]
MREEMNDEELLGFIVTLIKEEIGKNGSFSPFNLYSLHKLKDKGIEEDKYYFCIQKLINANAIIMTDEPGGIFYKRYKLTPIGNLMVGDSTEFIFLEPENYVKKLKEEINNIDSITISYNEESIKAYKEDLLLSSTVTLGCASENSILELIESFCKFINDPNLIQDFEKEWGIKSKYEKLKNEYKNRKVKTQIESEFKKLGQSLSDDEKSLFIDFETILDNLFNIYRISRNEVGHPTGKGLDKDILKAYIASFKRYATTIFGIKGIMDEIISKRS